ncbi:MAG: hypothetical protein AAF081_01355 [Actinomycetota bacterium]
MTTNYTTNEARVSGVSPKLVDLVRLPAYRTIGRVLRRGRAPRRILILGHMRAGSTLLSEVIAAHPSVLGFGELFLPVRGPKDLWAIDGKCQLRAGSRTSARGEIVLDKLLHDYLSPLDVGARLRNADTALLFLVRSPDGSVPSMISTFGFREKRAVDYYTSRIDTLATMTDSIIPGATSAVTFHDVTERQDSTLEFLSEHLRLDPPLTGRFSRSERTTGDRTTNIAQGRILSSDERSTTDERTAERPMLSDDALAECWASYDRCVEALRRTCAVPPGFAERAGG